MVMPISDKEYIADLGECMTKLEADLAALREENARLRDLSVWGTSEPVGPKYDEIQRLTRERDEARAEAKKALAAGMEVSIKYNEAAYVLLRCVEALANVDASDGVPEYVRRNVRAALAAAKGGE